jgi:hypothetical protein
MPRVALVAAVLLIAVFAVIVVTAKRRANPDMTAASFVAWLAAVVVAGLALFVVFTIALDVP